MSLTAWRKQAAIFGDKPRTEGDPLAEAALELLEAAGGKPVIMGRPRLTPAATALTS